MILEQIPLWVATTNSWIVSADGVECVIIDIPPDPTAVLDRLHRLNLRPVAIIATHGHVDHVGGVSSFLKLEEQSSKDRGKRSGVDGVHIHPADRHMLVDPLSASSMLRGMLLETGLDFSEPEHIFDLSDGDSVAGASMSFRAIHTPGHTKGSSCLSLAIEGQPPILFSGDHLFKGSIGRTDLPGGSFEELISSMKERILPLPDETVVLPGHGDSTTIGYERRTNPFISGI